MPLGTYFPSICIWVQTIYELDLIHIRFDTFSYHTYTVQLVQPHVYSSNHMHIIRTVYIWSKCLDRIHTVQTICIRFEPYVYGQHLYSLANIWLASHYILGGAF